MLWINKYHFFIFEDASIWMNPIHIVSEWVSEWVKGDKVYLFYLPRPNEKTVFPRHHFPVLQHKTTINWKFYFMQINFYSFLYFDITFPSSPFIFIPFWWVSSPRSKPLTLFILCSAKILSSDWFRKKLIKWKWNGFFLIWRNRCRSSWKRIQEIEGLPRIMFACLI